MAAAVGRLCLCLCVLLGFVENEEFFFDEVYVYHSFHFHAVNEGQFGRIALCQPSSFSLFCRSA